VKLHGECIEIAISAYMYSLESFTGFIHYAFIGPQQDYGVSSKGGRDNGRTLIIAYYYKVCYLIQVIGL